MANESVRVQSLLQEAASLPPEAPHILSVSETAEAVDDAGVAAVIDIDDFEDALRDPVNQNFLREAVAYGKKLQAEGRSV